MINGLLRIKVIMNFNNAVKYLKKIYTYESWNSFNNNLVINTTIFPFM